jgi:hypothetical protein
MGRTKQTARKKKQQTGDRQQGYKSTGTDEEAQGHGQRNKKRQRSDSEGASADDGSQHRKKKKGKNKGLQHDGPWTVQDEDTASHETPETAGLTDEQLLEQIQKLEQVNAELKGQQNKGSTTTASQRGSGQGTVVVDNAADAKVVQGKAGSMGPPARVTEPKVHPATD